MELVTKHIRKTLRTALLAGAAVLAFSSCERVFEDEGDCDPWIRLVYDINMKWADASPSEVASARVYVFDKAGTFVKGYHADHAALQADRWKIHLTGLDRDDYDLLVWCGLDGAGNVYDVPADADIRTKADVTCRMTRSAAGEVGEIPYLFHGEDALEADRHFSGTDTLAVHLTKNTNYVRIMLQDNSERDVDVDDFEAYITDDNGYLRADNVPVADQVLTYRPFYTINASTDQIVKAGEGVINVAVMEFTLNRLYLDKPTQARLTIHNKVSGETVLSIPLYEYFLLIKGHYRDNLPAQEYLDRQDDWSMTFFLQHGQWVSSQIIINSWKVVINDVDL